MTSDDAGFDSVLVATRGYSFLFGRGLSVFAPRLLLVASIMFSLASAAVGQEQDEEKRDLLGAASNIVPESIAIDPGGNRFAAIVVNPQTQKRTVMVDCKTLPGEYDMVAKGTPIFSLNGQRIALVASRRGKCFVVIDGKEGRNYDIDGDRWPIADLVFSPTGRYVAYKTRKQGKNYLVVNETEFGPYDDVIIEGTKTAPGIGDFRFADSDDFFSYRAKVGDKMVACRGWIQGPKIDLATSKEYDSIGVGTPIWLRGQAGGQGHAFAFIARERDKEFISFLQDPNVYQNFLPGLNGPDNQPRRFDFIRRGSLMYSPNSILGFVAREGDKWNVVIRDAMWKPCDAVGQLMYSPSGNRWACDAILSKPPAENTEDAAAEADATKKDENTTEEDDTADDVVLMINNEPSAGYDGIRYPGTVFVAEDDRAYYAAVKGEKSYVVVDGQQGEGYREVEAASIAVDRHRQHLAYVAGDGEKRFVVLDGWKGPTFEQISNLRFCPNSKRFAYTAANGLENYVVVDEKIMGPYETVAPGSPVFNRDGRSVAWAAMDKEGNWRVFVDGQPGPAFDAIVSQVAYPPAGNDPVYVARILSEGKYSFAMIARGEVGREYTSIWMGDGGSLFVRENGRVDYFGKRGPLVYKVSTPANPPAEPASDESGEQQADGEETDDQSGQREVVTLPARCAWLKGEGLSRKSGMVSGWNDQTQARWDFVCPADGTYELFISYGCDKDGAGSEFAVDVAGGSHAGKVESTGGADSSSRFPLAKVEMRKGEVYNALLRVTKPVGKGMNLSSVELIKQKK